MESSMNVRWIFFALLVWLANPAVANAQPNSHVSRGELLYSTYCIACHTDKIHWRDNKIAKDWAGLNAEVRRWQGIEGFKWSGDDIAEVARHLNALYYHYPEPSK
jgi:mono/diheme cytochrome c family protein